VKCFLESAEVSVEQRSRMVLAVAVAASMAASMACRGSEPDEQNLRDSFAEQVASVGFVKSFERRGDELTFRAPYEANTEVAWRVRIDSATVEPNDDERQPFKGTVKSSWYADGRLIEPRDSYSDLPSDFLDKGIAQDCYAYWDGDSRKWSWT
jgi:hypothetical protein